MVQNNTLGPYELRGELGRGAMAKVWRGWDPKLEREVAIKEPLFDERLSPEVLEEMGSRFVKEGKAAARLNHPCIVTIYAADVYDSRPVIVMELIDGITLSEMLDSGSMTPQSTLDALDQLLDAVGYAHSQGVVHRDIKPDNIFVTKDGRIKLSDFGIAHMDDSSMTHATQLGTVLGTPGYMAPEQATGSAIDNRTDLFAIGTIAYEMLTGKNPFGVGEATNPTTLIYRIVHEPVPELPDAATEGLPADIRPAIFAALNKNPDDRPQDADAFKAMLHGAPVPISSKTSARSSVSSSTNAKSKKWLPYALVGAFGVLIVGIVFALATSGGGGLVSRNDAGGDKVNNTALEQAQSDTRAAADYEVLYEDLLSQYKEPKKHGLDSRQLTAPYTEGYLEAFYDSLVISITEGSHPHMDSENVHYAFFDIDNNGIPELLIGYDFGNAGSLGLRLLSIYTLDSQEDPVLVCRFHGVSAIYGFVLIDYDDEILVYTEGGDSGIRSDTASRLNGAHLEPVWEGKYDNGRGSGNVPECKINGSTYSEDEYMRFWESFESAQKPSISWKQLNSMETTSLSQGSKQTQLSVDDTTTSKADEAELWKRFLQGDYTVIAGSWQNRSDGDFTIKIHPDGLVETAYENYSLFDPHTDKGAYFAGLVYASEFGLIAYPPGISVLGRTEPGPDSKEFIIPSDESQLRICVSFYFPQSELAILYRIPD